MGVLEQWPEIKAPRLTELLRTEHGYAGSVDLVRRRLAGLRVLVEPAQRTGYRPGQVVQFDWGEMPTRPRIAGVERRVYGPQRYLAFGKLAFSLARDSPPIVPYGFGVSEEFYSPRIGCQTYGVYQSADLAALCIRRQHQ